MHHSLRKKFGCVSEIKQNFHSAKDCQQRINLNGIIQEFLELFSIMPIQA